MKNKFSNLDYVARKRLASEAKGGNGRVDRLKKCIAFALAVSMGLTLAACNSYRRDNTSSSLDDRYDLVAYSTETN